MHFFIDLIHITSKASSSSSSSNAEEDLKPYVQRLMNFFVTSDAVSPIVWSMYFNIPTCEKCRIQSTKTTFKGVHIACGPSFELDYDSSINDVSFYYEFFFCF